MKHIWRRKVFTITVIIILVLIGCIFIELYRSKYLLQVSVSEISSDKITNRIRIVQLSDNHNSIFGKDNQQLIEKVKEQAPDIILMTGDLINSNEANTNIATNLISALRDIAPVYVSLGNHEVEYRENYGTNIYELYKKAGAVVLDKQYEDIIVNGQSIRLGGIYGYCLPAKYLETKEADPEECAFLTDFQSTEYYTILMCHIPVCWLINDGLNEWNIDAVFAGHDHGGQIRIPGIGGLWAPDQGWFPGRESGLYYSSDNRKVLMLSRGLGSNEKIPRFNNIPEIVVVDFVPK